jgi:hypothetical protein
MIYLIGIVSYLVLSCIYLSKLFLLIGVPAPLAYAIVLLSLPAAIVLFWSSVRAQLAAEFRFILRIVKLVRSDKPSVMLYRVFTFTTFFYFSVETLVSIGSIWSNQ